MFDLRKQLVDDFSEYIRSFLKVRDVQIQDYLEDELRRGALWPEPLLSLNPTFEPGGLVANIPSLHAKCESIFRRQKSEADPIGQSMSLYKHQVQAIDRAIKGRNYVLTTGTGSGKSLSYILPIVGFILKEGPGKGVRAVVVYPMNALANSQEGELKKYLEFGPAKGSVKFARYTGQEDQDEKDKVAADPPDIILTNYVMLELMLTRPFERKIIESMGNLKFIVFDELHTYRGRQGADVSLLIRRLREITKATGIQCVGTSATMATDGTAAQKRATVADVASKIFGSPFEPDDIIGETLLPFSTWRKITPTEMADSLKQDPPTTRQAFREHPLTIWLEHEIALKQDDEGRLIRNAPAPLFGPESTSARLADLAGIPLEQAEATIQRHLIKADELGPDENNSKPFVFRLHQFMSPGDGIFSTLGTQDQRTLSLEGQKSAPDDPNKLFYPLAFCRSCGQHYYIVTRAAADDGKMQLFPRRLRDAANGEDATAGFVYVPESQDHVDLDALLPDDWYEETNNGRRIRRNRKSFVPSSFTMGEDGAIGGDIEGWFINQPFSLCMNPECGASYGPYEGDITKLSILGMQGRSTATTTLALSTLAFLKETDAEAKKLLSFSDNRQDASLQSGHLNDFVEVGMLRAAIRSVASKAGDDGVSHDQIALEVEKELALDQEDYASQAAQLPNQIKVRREALRDVLGYRIYRDLRRGWRVNAPNLEQVGLLKIEYPDLPAICADPNRWQGRHELLVVADLATREKVLRDMLERLRKKLAIRVDYLDPEYQEGIKRRSSQYLKQPWSLSDEEAQAMDSATYAWLDKASHFGDKSDLLLTGSSAFGIYLRLPSTFNSGKKLTVDETQHLIEDLVEIAEKGGLLAKVKPTAATEAYQLNAEAFYWMVSTPGEEHKRTHNRFFERFYVEGAKKLKGIYSREHTAQVKAEDRELREELFRAGKLPIMFCSPTMELGVDISDLSVVNMRNVPPTPANYAQRSGRAGRSGQPALVFTYCTAGSPHDQYYFRRPEDMVAGAVAAPRLDLTNEDLVRAHIHAIWLSEASLDLGKSLADAVLDVAGDNPTLALRKEIQDKLHNTIHKDRTKLVGAKVLEAIGPEIKIALWYTDRWLSDVVDQIPLAFDKSCDRWRNLYRSALDQAKRQDLVIRDASASATARERADRLRKEAEKQMALLTESKSESQSDFYAYRYFASEGFLPGYNFPRLPLSAFLPARRGPDEYLSRPRFLAISEFGPGAVIYHEGSRFISERVMMPPSVREDGGNLAIGKVKLCTKCGYFHAGEAAETADVCERCGSTLEADALIQRLFRLEGVSLRRRDRITCDEEERMRQGYEIRTGIRYDGRPGEELTSKADIKALDNSPLASLTYAQTATIWRINVGWNRRKNKDDLGYQLDLDRAKWISEKGASLLMEADPSEIAQRVAKVVPYVEDRRNALIFQWTANTLPIAEIVSLKAALKSAIQAVFQLEDSELSAESLPNNIDPKMILFYESAEGGAGVLRRIAEDPEAIPAVARKALEICHFDPETLVDLGKHPRAREQCSSACYDCLMSYGNQRDHLHADRKLILDHLVALRDSHLEVSGGNESRSQKLQKLMDSAGSNLEREWLKLLEENNLTLPTYGQFRIEDCHTVPDFAYVHGPTKLAVYIDGPPHDYPTRQMRDSLQDMALMMKGWLVQRFHHQSDWTELLRKFPSVYGELR